MDSACQSGDLFLEPHFKNPHIKSCSTRPQNVKQAFAVIKRKLAALANIYNIVKQFSERSRPVDLNKLKHLQDIVQREQNKIGDTYH